MQNPCGMGGAQSVGHRRADRQRLGDRERSLGDAVGERATAHQLHRDVGLAVRGEARCVHGADPGMVRQHAHGASFAVELPSSRIVEEGGEHLDGHLAPMGLVAHSVHGAEATAPDHLDDSHSFDSQVRLGHGGAA